MAWRDRYVMLRITLLNFVTDDSVSRDGCVVQWSTLKSEAAMSEVCVTDCSRQQPQICLRVSDVQSWLCCALCGGYLIDATTISRCLHTCELSSRLP